MKWYLYIDWGSGYTLITPYDLQMDLSIEVDESINKFVKRKKASGTFKLYGSESTTADTYFITNGNNSAPFRIYENGILGTGTLEYQGFVNIKAEYDNRRSLITFDSFKTDDDYEPVLAVINEKSTIIESLSLSGDFTRFYSQGQNTNCSKLQAYSLSGSTWASTGNALSLGDVGRIAMDNLGAGVVVYDNNSKQIHRYIYSAPNWSLSSIGTTLDLTTAVGALVGNGAICSISNTQIIFAEDGYNSLYFMTSTTGTFTINTTVEVESLSKPSLAMITNTGTTYIALVDNGSKVLRAYNTSFQQVGNTLSLGNLENICICSLDGTANNRIALTDTKTNTLRCYTFNGTNFSEVGQNIKISTMYEPQLTQDTVNAVSITDAISGFIARYSFSGTSWTQSGTNTSISGGYMSACGNEGTYLGVIQSDCFAFKCSRTVNYYQLLNAVLSDLSLGLSVPSTGHGATFDIEKVYIGELSNLSEQNSDATPINFTRVTLKQLFDIAEIFQNYWYIDGSNIKFTQPDLFSSVGTNFNISTLQRASLYVKDENDQVSYQDGFNIAYEKIEFKNENSTEHVGLPIDYSRDNENEIVYAYNYTTDFEYIVDWFTNQKQNLDKSGLFLAYIELDADFGRGIISDTGVIGSSDTRNNYCSKSQIMESFWKDYRYESNRNFTLNGNSVAPQDTVRDIIRYITLNLDYSDLSLSSFPASVGSITWDTGKVAYIYRFSVSLDNNSITIDSGLLDL